MKRILILTFLGMFFVLTDVIGQSRKERKANKETLEWKYDIESAAMGNHNLKVVKVWSFSKDPKVAKNQAIKNAAHGIIFKGTVGDSEKGIAPVFALISDVATMDKHSAFFKDFFSEGGDYRKYVSTTTISDEVIRLEKRMYKVGVTVNIRYADLRKMLEKEGIVKKLGAGF